jgi:hypothetical protein
MKLIQNFEKKARTIKQSETKGKKVDWQQEFPRHPMGVLHSFSLSERR